VSGQRRDARAATLFALQMLPSTSNDSKILSKLSKLMLFMPQNASGMAMGPSGVTVLLHWPSHRGSLSLSEDSLEIPSVPVALSTLDSIVNTFIFDVNATSFMFCQRPVVGHILLLSNQSFMTCRKKAL